MRDDSRKRLERALMFTKLKWAGVAVAAAGVVGVMLYFKNLDASVQATQSVVGTVVYVGPLTGKFKAVVAEDNLQVDVKLDDTRMAHLIAPRDKAPRVGEHVSIADKIHGSGRHSFSWQ